MASNPEKRPEKPSRGALEKKALEYLRREAESDDLVAVGIEEGRDPNTGKRLHRVYAARKGNTNGPHLTAVLDDEVELAADVREAVFGPPVFELPDGLTLTPAKPITIDPKVNELTLRECETFDEVITVTVPKNVGARKADVYFLADTTGSMIPILNAVQAGATSILNAPAFAGRDVAFGVGNYKDFPSDPYAFQHQQPLDTDKTLAQAAINTWSASGGSDGAEGQLFALHQIATSPAIGWRPDSERILVWFGDAPGHDPVCSAISGLASNLTEASVTAELQGPPNVTVLAISTTTGIPNALDADPTGFSSDYAGTCSIGGSAGQAQRITGATGGQHVSGINAANVVQTIIDLIDNAVTTINHLDLVASGATAPFVVSISPAGGYGPLKSDEEHQLEFRVRFEGVAKCRDEPQTFVGSLDVVADGARVASKRVVITVPACQYHYSVKFLCGVQKPDDCWDETVRPGIYATEINILNPHACAVKVEKCVIPVVLAGEPIGREPRYGRTRAEDRILLPPKTATMDDCRRLSELLFKRPRCRQPLTVGFLTLSSDRELDVTAVYTASDLEGRHSSLEVETIRGAHR